MTHGLKKYGLVLAEGREDIAVLKKIVPKEICNKLKYEDYKGKDKLKSFLETIPKSPGYTSGHIQKILITRDADESWESAWQAVNAAVHDVFKIEVSEPGQWTQIENGPQITIWIAPGTKKEGMIETLYLEAAKNSDAQVFDCLEKYIECLETKDSIELHEKERFDIWTIVAQGTGPVKGRKRLPFSDAIERLPLDWNSAVFSEIKKLLVETSKF